MRRIVVGLTGGIGSGKSTVLAAFSRCGAGTVSADAVAHELSRPGRPLYRRIVRQFGPGCVAPSGELDRAAIARRVFRNSTLRSRLERETHPAILREMRRRIRRLRGPVVVADVPLLFEVGLAREFDATVMVSAARAAVLGRLRRRGMNTAEALRRMRAQWPVERKEALADVVLRNDGSRKELLSRTKEYYKAFELIAAAPAASGRRN